MLDSPNLISVVIPLYNKAAYVERSIRSALRQGEAVFEVVVVDDGSTDNSADIVESMQAPKVRLIRQSNSGVSSARNRGIKESRGEYICFLDADDVYLPGFLDQILDLKKQFPQAHVYATSYTQVWPDGRRFNAGLPACIDQTRPQLLEQLFLIFSRSSIFSISSSACVKRTAFYEHGIFFPLGESVGEDQDVIYRLAEEGEIAFAPKFLAEYTKGVVDSLYSTLPTSLPLATERLAERLKSDAYPKRHKAGARRMLSVYCLNIARINLDQGQLKQGLRLLLRKEAYYHVVYWLRTAIRFALPKVFFQSRWTRRI